MTTIDASTICHIYASNIECHNADICELRSVLLKIQLRRLIERHSLQHYLIQLCAHNVRAIEVHICTFSIMWFRSSLWFNKSSIIATKKE